MCGGPRCALGSGETAPLTTAGRLNDPAVHEASRIDLLPCASYSDAGDAQELQGQLQGGASS